MIGKTLGNRYEIIEKVGEGGMAKVYKARCHLLDRNVAIKVLKSEFNDDEEFVKKFRRESQAAASLSHPNILSIYDVGLEEVDGNKVYYIVMEFIDGKTLKDVIKEKGKLNEDEAIRYSLQISEALLHAHNNHIIHRDIKPQNIMLTSDDRIKVTDFGIARAATSTTVTTSTDVLGSVHYFSPEQARGGFTDEKSDIYSLGIVMYEMITGQLPYVGDTPVAVALQHIQNEMKPPKGLNPDMSSSYEAIILKCTEKRQNRRYDSVSSLITDLRNIETITPADINGEDEDITETRVIPVIKDDEIIDDPEMDQDEEEKKGGIKGIVLGVLLAFLLVTGVFYGFSRLRESFRNDEVEVPYLVGMDEEAAEDMLEDLGLEFNVVDRVSSEEFEEGKIVSQSVEEGTMVREGFTIDVYVSLGIEMGQVPNVENLPLDEAERIIRDAGFRVGGPEYEYDGTVALDRIISQSPSSGEELEPGGTIHLVVSLGEETQSIIMPRVIDRSVNEARTMLRELGLDANITYVDSDEPADIVIWQEYNQGTELEPNTIVNLRVSSGPAPEPEPEPEPEPDPEPNPEPEPTPPPERSVTLNISVHEDKESTVVEIRRTQNGVTETVYNQSHRPEEGEIPIVVQAQVGARLDVYFDGEQQESITVPAG